MKTLKFPKGALIKIIAYCPQQTFHTTVKKQHRIMGRCSVGCFTYANLFHLHEDPVKWGPLLIPFCRQLNRCSEKLSNFPRVTQLGNNRAWIKPSHLALAPILSGPKGSCLYRDDNNIYLGSISKIFV